MQLNNFTAHYVNRFKFLIYLLSIFSCLYHTQVAAEETQAPSQQEPPPIEEDLDWDISVQEEVLAWGYYRNFDLYYTNAGIIYNLGDQIIPDIGAKNESQVYLDLLKRSGIPQYLLFEFSIYPIPIAGVYFREKNEKTYDQISIGNNFNLIESISAGFEEPYAFSLFLNNTVTYGAKGDLNNNNRGFMGYLLSIGNYHLQRNRLVKDDWLELEWKIKGDIQRDKERLSWSFRLGGKFHRHPEIIDTFYVILRRSQINTNKPIFSWLYNTSFEFTYRVSQNSLSSVGFQIFADKKIPIKFGGTVFSIGLGIMHKSNKNYLGQLRETQQKDSQTFVVIRPSIEF